MVTENTTGTIDCACVIHGDAYSWEYVDRLYSMLQRHLTRPVRLHVYTEADRDVPAPYIKHELDDWGQNGPKRAWWYKMQLFNTKHHQGPLLYFDLDIVIVDNIDWIWNLNLDYFWAVRDFKYLWRQEYTGINSSVMWFDTQKFDSVWQQLNKEQINRIISRYRGDQDYINSVIPLSEKRLFDHKRIKSWRWQCLDGGYAFETRKFMAPNTGTVIPETTSILVFHGNPKPSTIEDPVIVKHWQ